MTCRAKSGPAIVPINGESRPAVKSYHDATRTVPVMLADAALIRLLPDQNVLRSTHRTLRITPDFPPSLPYKLRTRE